MIARPDRLGIDQSAQARGRYHARAVIAAKHQGPLFSPRRQHGARRPPLDLPYARLPQGRRRAPGAVLITAIKFSISLVGRCGSLVDWRAARGAATKAGRGLRAGDGCRGPQCGKRRKARAARTATRPDALKLASATCCVKRGVYFFSASVPFSSTSITRCISFGFSILRTLLFIYGRTQAVLCSV